MVSRSWVAPISMAHSISSNRQGAAMTAEAFKRLQDLETLGRPGN